MRIILSKLIITLISIALTLVSFNISQATEPSNPERQIVHILDYLATDYAGAVSNGKVTNQAEYDEQIEFSETALKLIKESTLAAPHLSQFQKLNQLILSKSSPEDVASLARSIQVKVIEISKIETFPKTWPSLKKGSELYKKNCVSCHGNKGLGDGEVGRYLNPPPLNFIDGPRMNIITPFQAFNSIRLGIPGTGMVSNLILSDSEVWDLSFYSFSLRHQESRNKTSKIERHKIEPTSELLQKLASKSDEILSKHYSLVELALLRSIEPDSDDQSGILLAIARIKESEEFFNKGDRKKAKQLALTAYLDGVELVEPRLKSKNGELTSELESKMAALRSLLEHGSETEINMQYKIAYEILDKANQELNQNNSISFGLTFSLTSGILLREGFEAILILIALLGVLQAAKAKKAILYLHSGWITALGVSVIAWIFSEPLTHLSGKNRELMEGVISIFAVIILLYLGFWLHSKTEITRWKEFIDVRVTKALQGGNLIGIALISFFAVFREAFETVLFLRAITLESGYNPSLNIAMFAGVCFAMLVIIIFAFAMMHFSKLIPIRQLFAISSILMIVLATILIGKSMHAFQEVGIISSTRSNSLFSIELLGFFPTIETFVAQILVFALSVMLWKSGSRSKAKK